VLSVPEPFYVVGLHYADFPQTADEEVKRLLDGAGTACLRPGSRFSAADRGCAQAP
jgi:predicted phosphoribosyltransferase